MNRLTGFFILLVCMACFGCKTVSNISVNVGPDFLSHETMTLAVMRFDDKLVQDKGVKGVVVTTVGNPDAGEVLAGILTSELQSWGKYKTLTRSEVKKRMKAGGASEEELVNRKDYATLGKILRADAVVIGKIQSFDLSSMTVYERGDVSFTADCINIKNGNILWSVRAKESAPYKDEIELASKVISEAIERLKMETK